MCNHSQADEACARALLADEQEATIAVMDKLGRAEQRLRRAEALLSYCQSGFREIANMEGREGITDDEFAKAVLDRIAPRRLERLDQFLDTPMQHAACPSVKAA